MFEQNQYFLFTPHILNVSSNSDSSAYLKSGSESDKKELQSCKNQLVEANEKFVRVSADFENYKRRMQKEQSQWFDLGQSKVLTQLLDIADDFDRAIAQQQAAHLPVEAKAWFEGFELTHKALLKLLESFEIKEISPDLPFDPELHEALVSVENSGRNSGDVVEILQKGYTYKGKVLRPAKVSVAK